LISDLTDVFAWREERTVSYTLTLQYAEVVFLLERTHVSFGSVTQQFNTTRSMGRLILNVLLSFAQFELEVTRERIRDNIAASNRRGCGWAVLCRPAMTRASARSSSTWPRPKRGSADRGALSRARLRAPGQASSLCAAFPVSTSLDSALHPETPQASLP